MPVTTLFGGGKPRTFTVTRITNHSDRPVTIVHPYLYARARAMRLLGLPHAWAWGTAANARATLLRVMPELDMNGRRHETDAEMDARYGDTPPHIIRLRRIVDR